MDRKWKERQIKTLPTEEAKRLSAMRDVEVNIGWKMPTYRTPKDRESGVSSVGNVSNTMLRVDGDDVDTLKKNFTLDVPLDDVFGSIYDTCLIRSEKYIAYMDDVMADIDNKVDEMYSGW